MARLKGFEKLANVDEALSIFLKALDLRPLSAQKIPTGDALGRVAAEKINSPTDLPQFDRSAVDGYAVKAEDTFGVSQFRPKTLKLVEKGNFRRGLAKQIWTGNMLPTGSDAVIMLERTRAAKDEIQILTALTPGENVSKKGEDIGKGKVAVEKSTRLRPHHLGLLAALGIDHVNVIRRPKVAILSTGDELVELGQKPRPNEIVNSNRFALGGLCSELGVESTYLGIAKDNEREIAAKVVEGLEKADVVITTGGTSVGAADLVTITLNKIGRPGVIVHGIAMRPGMPTALAIAQEKPILVLSGYPVACIVGFEVFARPVLLKLQGIEWEPRPTIKARLTHRVVGALGRTVYLRVKAFEQKGEYHAEPIRAKGSGLITSLTKANGFVIITEDREGLEQGETVIVHLFSPLGRYEGSSKCLGN